MKKHWLIFGVMVLLLFQFSGRAVFGGENGLLSRQKEAMKRNITAFYYYGYNDYDCYVELDNLRSDIEAGAFFSKNYQTLKDFKDNEPERFGNFMGVLEIACRIGHMDLEQKQQRLPLLLYEIENTQ